MLKVVPKTYQVELHDPSMAICDSEHHIRRASNLSRVLWLLVRTGDDFSDVRDHDGLAALVDEIATHASAAEHLLDAPKES